MENKKAERQVDLIKATFKNNEVLLTALRRKFLQLPLSGLDQSTLEINKEIKDLLMEVFAPGLQSETPFGIQTDFFLSVPLKETAPDVAVLHLRAIKIWKDYFVQQIEGKKEEIILDDLANMEGKSDEQIFIDMFARNLIITSTEQKLGWLEVTANEKKKTKEELEEERNKNSSK